MATVQARRQDAAAGGAKNQKGGGTFFKYSIGWMKQPVGQTWNGGGAISNGGGRKTLPSPLATAPRPCINKNSLSTVWGSLVER